MPAEFDATTFDYVNYMMSLPQYLEPDWLNWPQAQAFAIPDTSRQKMRLLFKPRPQKLKVGIVWSGSVTFQNNHLRATNYTRFLELAAQHLDIQFFSLQKGPRENDILEHGMGSILPIGHVLDDFGDSVAALDNLDLLIMTDSGLAHLAGTQGVPVLNLLNFLHYWLYYPRKDSTTPLYPSWRFIRQPKEGDWDFVFDRVNIILEQLTQAAHKQSDKLSSDQVLKIIDSANK